jgi:hypothetical protein
MEHMWGKARFRESKTPSFWETCEGSADTRLTGAATDYARQDKSGQVQPDCGWNPAVCSWRATTIAGCEVMLEEQLEGRMEEDHNIGGDGMVVES